MQVSVWLFALGQLAPLLTTSRHALAVIVPFAFAAVVLMTLPYALLMTLLPDTSEHGAAASLLEFSQGLGVIFGPLLAGLAVQLTAGAPVLTFRDTSGLSAIFAVTMVLLLASAPLLARIREPAPAG